jgi:hypothetical protein
MSRARRRRHRTIEAQEPPQPQTVIWCNHPAEMPEAIVSMLRAGELRPGEIHTCIHWKKSGVPPVPHEVALAELE